MKKQTNKKRERKTVRREKLYTHISRDNKKKKKKIRDI